MQSQVFGSRVQGTPNVDRIEQAKEHLALHNLLGKKTNVGNLIDFPLPELIGEDLDEHFHKIGRKMSEPYLTIAKEFVDKKLPNMPKDEHWIKRSGWTRYSKTNPKQSRPVEYPNDDILVFDTEVLYKISDFPVMAVAVSEKYWYGWVSPWLLGETQNPRQLIPLGTREKEKVVIGHNVGYDRKRIKDEYHIKPSKAFFIDTMSLHIAVNGMCSRQRPAWMRMNKLKKKSDKEHVESVNENENENDNPDGLCSGTPSDSPDDNMLSCDLEENPWFSHSALNNLADVAMLHCNIKIDKGSRDYFGILDRQGVLDKFGELMTYCATDVDVTFKVFQKVLPNFLEVCQHPISFGALRHLSSCFLPINDKWEQFASGAEAHYQQVQLEIYNRLKKLAEDAIALLSTNENDEKVVTDKILSDPWLSQLDWTIKPIKMVKGKKGLPDRPYKNQKFPGLPQWYKDLFQTAKSPMNISLRTRIAPLLLRLQWDDHPLIWCDNYGWIFKIKNNKESTKYKKLNYTKCDLSTFTEEEIAKYKLSERATYFKIPHNNGQDARCTNPMAKQYIKYFEKDVLSSQFEYAKSAVELNSQCTYWISSRERIFKQMPVFTEDTDMGITTNSTDVHKFGMIIPKLIPMGTVTRRAVEDLWLTASNAKKTRIGSELKAMVQAPPGYKFVGADVDSEELWIASLIGDSLFGIHGGTALGWMTLEGNKKDGTDLHSKTAGILGISRNDAKVFNYGRIYGAGLRFAIQLLKQFNPLISDKEAEEAASKLYEATKGTKAKSNAFVAKKFWRGGTESIVFNRLEEMAEQDVPRTPVLGAAVTQALMKQNLRKSNFLTSRINWTIQSSGVDYLHLLIASMDFLVNKYNIDARLVITVHDEIRYLVKDEDKYKAAFALQISNLWTRAMFCQQLGINNVPQSVAFFSLIDIDHVLRKEVDLDCITPSHPEPIPAGEAIDMVELLEKCSSLTEPPGGSSNEGYKKFSYEKRTPIFQELSGVEPNLNQYLAAQITNEDDKFKSIIKSVKDKGKRVRKVDDTKYKSAESTRSKPTKPTTRSNKSTKSTRPTKFPVKSTTVPTDTLVEASTYAYPIPTEFITPYKFPISTDRNDKGMFFDQIDYIPSRSGYREY